MSATDLIPVSGESLDSVRPDLTALCIPGMLRSLMLFGPDGIDEKTVSEQIIRLLTRGIVAEGRMLEDAR